MPQSLAHIALVVRDYDEAIDFYTKKLDFTLIDDPTMARVFSRGAGARVERSEHA